CVQRGQLGRNTHNNGLATMEPTMGGFADKGGARGRGGYHNRSRLRRVNTTPSALRYLLWYPPLPRAPSLTAKPPILALASPSRLLAPKNASDILDAISTMRLYSIRILRCASRTRSTN